MGACALRILASFLFGLKNGIFSFVIYEFGSTISNFPSKTAGKIVGLKAYSLRKS